MTKDEQMSYKDALDCITHMLEKKISNYALIETEDLDDKEEDIMLRAHKFSRGMNEYWVVSSPMGHIRYTERHTPKNLIVQINNIAVNMLLDCLSDNPN
jgi:hypothetical protein